MEFTVIEDGHEVVGPGRRMLLLILQGIQRLRAVDGVVVGVTWVLRSTLAWTVQRYRVATCRPLDDPESASR